MARKRLSQLFCILLSLLLLGCGHVKSARKLLRTAKATHGACTLISKTEESDKTVIEVKDKEQGFTYTMTSYMQGIVIDGSSFGSLPETTDTFKASLIRYVLGETKTDLVLMSISLSGEGTQEQAKALAEECAKVIAPYNVKDRLNYMEIRVDHDEAWVKKQKEKMEADGSHLNHIGSIRFPDLSFRDPKREKEDAYYDVALTYHSKSVFVRKEEKTFADTGLPLYRVADSSDNNSPKQNSDPVTFYYYKVDDTEFFVCDFLDTQTGTFYTNYNDVAKYIKRDRGIHISIH